MEPDDSFYRDGLRQKVAREAEARGLRVEVLAEPPIDGPESFPGHVQSRIAAAEHTIFFSRLGSTARLLKLPGPGSKVVSYTLDGASFASPCAALPCLFLQAVHDLVVSKIAGARSYRITCPRGTDLAMRFHKTSIAAVPALTPFTVRNFPLMIVPPISAETLTGTLALSLAILPTSTHVYEDPVLPLTSPLLLQIEKGRIIGFGGALAAQAEAHFDRVGRLVDGDPRAVNSWHTGINPATFFNGPALQDLQRWGNTAFGSPRYSHFHVVGSDPGDICGSLFDAKISFDGEAIWQDGHLALFDTEEGAALAKAHGVLPEQVAIQQPIGV